MKRRRQEQTQQAETGHTHTHHEIKPARERLIVNVLAMTRVGALDWKAEAEDKGAGTELWWRAEHEGRTVRYRPDSSRQYPRIEVLGGNDDVADTLSWCVGQATDASKELDQLIKAIEEQRWADAADHFAPALRLVEETG